MALFFIALFVVVGIFFAAMLIYGTREKTFEQAIEEQRNKSNFDLLLSSEPNAAHQQQQKKETRKEKAKKVKDAGSKKNSITKSAPAQASAAHGHKNGPAKVEQQVKSTTSAPAKVVEQAPVKVEAVVAQPDVVDTAPSAEAAAIATPAASSVKAPHHAKDTVVVTSKKAELKAAKQQAQLQQPQQQQQQAVVPEIGVIEKVAAPPASKAPEPSLPKANHNKKNKRAVSKASPKELSFEDILELVNSSYFSADDITRLTDALLNRQADEQNADYNWHKKNDPVEALQKQLAEKKELIDQQIKNIEAARKKTEMYSADITLLKKQQIKLQNENEKLRQEIEFNRNSYIASQREEEAKMRQKYETRFNEVRNEERTRLGHEIANLKVEIARLNDLVSSQADQEGNLAELAAAKAALEEKNRELLELVAEKEQQVDQVEQQLGDAETARAALESQIELLKKDLLEVKVQATESNSTEIEAFALEIKNLKAELSESANQREQLEATIAKLKSDNSAVATAKTSALKETESLKAKVAQLEAEKTELQSKVANVTSEKDSLSSKSDDLSHLIKSNDQKLEALTGVFSKLGLSIESDSLQQSLEELKTKASQYDALNAKNADLSEEIDQLNGEKESLKTQLDSLKQGNKEESKLAEEYSAALQETEKILNDLQEKYMKNKSEQNAKLEEFERLLSEKTEENESVKEELSKCRDNIDQLNKLNDNLTGQLRDLKELVSSNEAVIAGFKAKEDGLSEDLEKIKEENKNLNSKIVKLNNLVQIGKHSFQEESEKVQSLESKLLLNGKENNNGTSSSSPTSNGNSS